MSLDLFRAPFRVPSDSSLKRSRSQKRCRSRSPPSCVLDRHMPLSPGAAPHFKMQRHTDGTVSRARAGVHPSPNSVLVNLSREGSCGSVTMTRVDSGDNDDTHDSCGEMGPTTTCLSSRSMRSSGNLVVPPPLRYDVGDDDDNDDDDDDDEDESPDPQPLRREAAFRFSKSHAAVWRMGVSSASGGCGAGSGTDVPNVQPLGRSATFMCTRRLDRDTSSSSVATAPPSTVASDRACLRAANRVFAPRLPPTLPRGTSLYGTGHPLKSVLYGCKSSGEESGSGECDGGSVFGFLQQENARMAKVHEERARAANARQTTPPSTATVPMWMFG